MSEVSLAAIISVSLAVSASVVGLTDVPPMVIPPVPVAPSESAEITTCTLATLLRALLIL